jgi:integrase
LAPSTWNRHWYKARAAAGRPDLHHLRDLRHSGLTWMAQAGATTRELMDAAGHSSPAAALRYQHVADGRRRELAARLSKIADES